MRIIWLFERTDQLWGGVKVALCDANWLQARGHDVTVVSRSGPPSWMELRCSFRQVDDLAAADLGDADVVVGTFWTTVPVAAAAAARGAIAVHYCQGYEGDNPEARAHRQQIEAVYRLPGVHHVTISPHLTRLLRARFGVDAHEIVYTVDHDTFFPRERPSTGPRVRVGLVGPYEIAWKDIPTGIEACRLAAAAGLELELVRVTNTTPHAQESNLPFPVEWHQRVPPDAMGEIYRSLDVFLGTSSGAEEGFFLPAVEAMASGVPCVLTDIPCFRAHGDGHYALFVPPSDPAAMAEALVVAGRAPDVHRALRNAGIAAAARYTQAAHGAALERVLSTLIGRDGERRTERSVAAPDPAAAQAALLAELRGAARRAEAAGDLERTAAFLAAAQCLQPTDPVLATDAAFARHLAGDTPQALRMFERFVADGLDHPRVHECHAMLLNGTGHPAAAAQALRAAIAAGSRTADTYNHLGIALYRTGDLAGARSSFERALVLDPHHRDALANVADLPAA